ncbi:ShlB/FhaC/HecB family hemolysin secretion/activation protein [Pollutimonas bauzanensis]|uniref:Hemolysin activation/secretion protein n=1 Tax=Pollutimonas bauzanensis TaxID=658167 RepID=A0A1M5REJ6_9BURK|nr:ShlB/FhaC/HecB family hemolysin secretion/activation protein [Pollutimonas bauzanensis]SHH24704.1 Hemolysin activation/secretion protein [Pollutimonas bauzanensis]
MKPSIDARRAGRPLRAPVCAALLSFLPAMGMAQTPPAPPYGIGDAMKEAQPRLPQRPPQKTPAPAIIQQEEAPLRMGKGETLFVREFKLEGAEFIDQAELQAQLEPYKGRALTLSEIQEAAAKLTVLYRSRGYLVARAYVPRQDASKGTLVIRILVGKFGQFQLKNQSLVRGGLLQGVFDALKSDQAVSQAALERAMLLVGDMPGAQMPKLTISPGQAPGTSDFDVEVGAGPRADFHVLADNQGSRYTGKNRLVAGLDLNSLLGAADKLSVQGLSSQDKGLLNGRLAYAFPLTAGGLRGELAATRTTYELGSDYKDLDATGVARTLEGTLSYPLMRSREQNLYLNLNFAAKRMRDEIGAYDMGIDKKAQVSTLSLRREAWSTLFGRSTYTNLDVGVSYGHLGIPDSAERALNKSGADTVGNYARLNLAFTASQELTKTLSASATVSAQKALMNKNLDTIEQMNISGPAGVKAYREVVSGDNGYLLNAELRYMLPAVGGLTQLIGVFADTGRVHLQQGDYSDINGQRLSDIGLGYYASYKSVVFQAQLARAVGPRGEAVADQSKTRLLAQVSLLF